jgi:hypothetical protein
MSRKCAGLKPTPARAGRFDPVRMRILQVADERSKEGAG